MNPENLAYLQDKLKFLGFGESSLLNEELREKTEKGDIAFQLQTATSYSDDAMLEAKLYFMMGNENRYYLQKYDARLRYDGDPDKNKAQTFFVYKGKGFTLKEAFNLLEGRAVYKKLIDTNGVEFQGWSKLNFNIRDVNGNYRFYRFGDQYGYDLEKVLELYPILNWQSKETKAHLVRSLQRGNLHPVYLVKGEKKAKCFIAANPESQMISISPMSQNAREKVEDILKEIKNDMSSELMESRAILPGPGDEQEEDILETETIGAPVEADTPTRLPASGRKSQKSSRNRSSTL